MSINGTEELIAKISRQFLSATPLKYINLNSILERLDWDLQNVLIQETINNKLNFEYPIKISYQKAFIKLIIDELEKNGIELNDEVYNAYGKLVAKNDSKECYRHYVNCDGDYITLKENVSYISEGTTGLSTWQGGVALAEWCIQNKNLFKNKKILELGSGVGFTGIAVAKYCDINKIYLSDCHNQVLENLIHNVKINSGEIISSDTILLYKTEFNKANLEVVSLPWDIVDEEIIKDYDVDILLAADVVYDSTIFYDLSRVIELFLKNGVSVMYLACTDRNSTTQQEFFKLLSTSCDVYTETTAEHQNYFWSTESPINIYRINSKCKRN